MESPSKVAAVRELRASAAGMAGTRFFEHRGEGLGGLSDEAAILLSKDGDSWAVLVTDSGADMALEQYVQDVGHPGAGAISSFSGVTRDNFGGRRVLKLEYEAYKPMAVKKLGQVCREAFEKWDLLKMVIAHRVGTVGVGEPSVVIVASSAHRREALEATQYAIDRLKAIVPVWKKEFYADGEVWKENAEGQYLLHTPAPAPA